MIRLNIMFKRVFLFFALLSNFFHSGLALNRDYCSFYIDEDGNLEYKDLEYLDSNNDQYLIYFLAYCVDHFNKSYLPYCETLKLDACLPKMERELLYLIPQFQVLGFRIDSEMVCGARLDKHQLCLKPINYPGYLDYDFHVYDKFLEEQLLHFKVNPHCQCYWPEYSKEAGRINDAAYLLFKNLLETTALSKLINEKDEQAYLLANFFWELNLHGLSVSCVARTFWFSHYYRLCLHLLEYAYEDYDAQSMTRKEFNQIYIKINTALLQLAQEFGPYYETCLKNHPSTSIESEIEFLRLLYPSLKSYSSDVRRNKIDIEMQKLQQEFDETISIKGRSLGIPKRSKSHLVDLYKKENYTNSHKFFAEFYLYQGLYLNDILSFQIAIEKFDTAINYDNKNKLTYLARAYANFELKNFEQALADYAIAKSLEITPPLLADFSWNFADSKCAILPKNKLDFSKGFILGGMEGFNANAKEFIPSVLHTVTGIGQGLWVFAKNPVHISQEFIENVCLYVELSRDYLESGDLEDIIPEMNKLLLCWEALTDFEKGRQVGSIIGKYGIDIFLTGKTIQLARKFTEVKYANGALTLEACESYIQRKALLEEANKRGLFRHSLFKDGKIKLNKDQQKKHILGPDFKEGRSPITISSEKLERLCAEKAATGEAVTGTMGKPGYKERVDFGEHIGECRYEKEKGIWVQEPTTMGILHYNAEGSFHVVPARPK
jgi:hypothetical protein